MNDHVNDNVNVHLKIQSLTLTPTSEPMHPSSDLRSGPRLSGLHSIRSSGHKTPALNLIKTSKRSHPAKPRFILSVAATATAAFLSLSTSQAKVDVQFWDMIWGGPEYIDAGKALVAQFNQEHPDINVTYRSIPWTNWYQTFVTAIGSGTAPDLSTGAAYQAVQLYDQGAILPVDDVISDQGGRQNRVGPGNDRTPRR